MDKAKIIEIEGAGSVLFEKSGRAKRLNITVRPVRGVRVAVPLWMSFDKAICIVRPRALWINKHRARLEKEAVKHEEFLAGLPPVDLKSGREKLAARLHEIASRHGFSYNRVFMRNQKTRWGSCSSKNNINLNMKLLRLPERLMDYVLLHELVHTKVKNHGKVFWKTVEELMPGARELDREMKRYRLDLL